MKTHDRRLKSLEDKAGTGDDKFKAIITEIFEPSPDGPKLVGFYSRLVGGDDAGIHSLRGECYNDFVKRLYETEVDI